MEIQKIEKQTEKAQVHVQGSGDGVQVWRNALDQIFGVYVTKIDTNLTPKLLCQNYLQIQKIQRKKRRNRLSSP